MRRNSRRGGNSAAFSDSSFSRRETHAAPAFVAFAQKIDFGGSLPSPGAIYSARESNAAVKVCLHRTSSQKSQET